MPILDASHYSPNFLYRNGHSSTLLTYILRTPKKSPYRRERIETPDGDFLDLDWIQNGNKRLVILCHGLEGDSSSSYLQSMANFLHKHHWDILAWNYRSCSKDMNRKLQSYNSGDTRDLEYLVHNYTDDYTEVVLIGFSLGGNIVLKYIGANTLPGKIISTVSISAPCDLEASSRNFSRRDNYLYEKRFLISLFEKVRQKAKMFPDEIDAEPLKHIKSIFEFDDVYTGPLGGFRDAIDYYTQCSSTQYIPNISIPTLIMTAEDDPFLHPDCFPITESKNSKDVYLLLTKHGGHVGFGGTFTKDYWSETETLQFINQYSQY